MSYDNPNRIAYLWATQDAGAGAVTKNIVGPKGKTGRVWDYGFLNVTEAFTADTLPSYVSVGLSGNADAYGEELSMATTAAGGGLTVRSSMESGAARDAMFPATIPAGTTVLITATAPTGGTPAGIGDLYVVIDWAD